MLLSYGDEVVLNSWEVTENSPTIYTRMYFVYSGEVIYKDANHEVLLKHGYLYCFPTNKPYTLRQNKKDKLSCMFIHYGISPYIVDELLEIDFISNDFLRSLNLAMKTPTTNSLRKKYAQIFPSLAESLISYLKVENFIKLHKSPVASAVELISNNPSINYNIDDLSRVCGYNSQYFVRLFKKHMEVSPHQYIINYKMQLAIKLLENSYTVSETAEKLGFTEVRSFSRSFKNHFGITASDFKNHVDFIP